MTQEKSFEKKLIPSGFMAKKVIFLTFVIFLLSGIFYFYRVDQPPALLWDEVYHVTAARSLMISEKYQYRHPNHPPLGRELIALSIWLGGDRPETHRLPAVLAGAGVAALLFLLGTYFGGHWLGGILAWGLWISSPLAFIHARLGMLDMPFTFFFTAGFGMFLVALERGGSKKSPLYLFGACFLMAIATAIKLIGVILIPIYLIGIAFGSRGWPWKKRLLQALGGSVAALLVVFLTSYGIQGYWPQEIPLLLKFMYKIQSHLHADYEGLSKWYEWFLHRGDLWYHSNPLDKRWSILCTNNPVLWIAGTLSLLGLGGIGMKKSNRVYLLLPLSVLIQILFWLTFKKQTILYYGLPMVPFFCLALPALIKEIFLRRVGSFKLYYLFSLVMLFLSQVWFWRVFRYLRPGGSL